MTDMVDMEATEVDTVHTTIPDTDIPTMVSINSAFAWSVHEVI